MDLRKQEFVRRQFSGDDPPMTQMTQTTGINLCHRRNLRMMFEPLRIPWSQTRIALGGKAYRRWDHQQRH
jgi:hypothetical protein